MGSVALIVFAFLVGLTVSSLAGSVLEIASGRRLAFVEPYVSPAHVLRSLGVPQSLDRSCCSTMRLPPIGKAV
jgi:hypothetical protein